MPLYAVRMDVAVPEGVDPAVRDETIAREKAYSQQLQRGGEWVHIWRCAGQYSNISIFDVTDNDRLHEILWGLPLFRWMTVDVTPLAKHPSAIN
ncbi:muconolactone Delta-isomerase [Tsukamurella sp. 8F]|uniref:muconolactone Delta-isomerase n=1 Tax=unclassified Tsukamurella TaxID=2633480 RepID=UPI0023B93DFC|nr:MULTISPECIES: muconolactone Delta-isomerase [unclassified Tsukamurella]MDF0528619.1 muconolactone Delta-isomerase [Tsukamurella sp. 8J]MDF0585581.1 muconolactone Delta-isomerase [Tsukamurella sp. 8F]